MDVDQEVETTSDLSTLFSTVVAGGYCIGCGACATLPASPVKIKLSRSKILQATVDDGIDLKLYKGSYQQVCPFSSESKNETQIGEQFFGESAKYY